MASRPRSVFEGDIGFEIRGYTDPKFKRKSLGSNDDDLNIDVPNGDLN